MMKRILHTALTLLLAAAVIAVGAAMPSLLSLISDGRLEHDILLQTGDATKLTFAKETPSTTLESVAYFSYLDSNNGKYHSEDLTLSQERVKTIIYNYFRGGWSIEQLNNPIPYEYDDWFTIILPMIYEVREPNDESFEEQSKHVFWECFWKTTDGRRFKVWVDDSSAGIVAFRLGLGEELLSSYTGWQAHYNFIVEEEIVSALSTVFKPYYEADSVSVAYCDSIDDDMYVGKDIDAWAVNYTSTEQHNGISSDSVVRTIIYFTNDTLCFNLLNSSHFPNYSEPLLPDIY